MLRLERPLVDTQVLQTLELRLHPKRLCRVHNDCYGCALKDCVECTGIPTRTYFTHSLPVCLTCNIYTYPSRGQWPPGASNAFLTHVVPDPGQCPLECKAGPCDVHATYMQHTCNIHATHIQHAYDVHARVYYAP